MTTDDIVTFYFWLSNPAYIGLVIVYIAFDGETIDKKAGE